MLCLTHEAGPDICGGESVKAGSFAAAKLGRILRHRGYTAANEKGGAIAGTALLLIGKNRKKLT